MSRSLEPYAYACSSCANTARHEPRPCCDKKQNAES